MKIRNIAAKTAAVLGCSALLALVPAIAGDEAVAGEDLGAEVSVGYDTDYIFRGANLGQDLLWSDVNVSTSLSDGLGLNIGAWYANPTDAGDDELDVYAGVSTDLGGMSLDVGTTYYYFPGATGDNTLEIGAALGTSVGAFDVSAGLYHDIDTDNTYLVVLMHHLTIQTAFHLISVLLSVTTKTKLLVVKLMVLQLLQSQLVLLSDFLIMLH